MWKKIRQSTQNVFTGDNLLRPGSIRQFIFKKNNTNNILMILEKLASDFIPSLSN